MERSIRPLRLLGAIIALLTGLFWLERAWEIGMDQYAPLMEYGNQFTGYGWGVFATIAVRVVVAGTLFWLFARLGSSKPIVLLQRRASQI